MNETILAVCSALLWYLVAASAASAALAAIGLATTSILRMRSPVHRHFVWSWCLAATLVLPLLWAYGPKVRVAPPPESPIMRSTLERLAPPRMEAAAPTANQTAPAAPAATTPSRGGVVRVADEPGGRSQLPVTAIIVFAWALAVTVMLARLAIAHVRLGAIRRGATRLDASSLGVSSGGFDLLASDEVDSPLCCGILRPAVILPRSQVEASASAQLAAILAHEIAHVERRDCAVNLVQRIVEAGFFFNPFVWLMSRRMRLERELICDNRAISAGVAATEYVSLLGNVVRRSKSTRALAQVALIEGSLLWRAKRLLDPREKRIWRMSRAGAVILTIAAVVAVAAIGAVALDAKEESPAARPAAATTGPYAGETYGPDGKRPTGETSISGKAISADTGEPVSGARVYLFHVDTDRSIFVNTGEDGSFAFSDVAGGVYSLTIGGQGGWQAAHYNPDNAGGQWPQFYLSHQRKLTGIVIKLKAAYSISGKVRLENGAAPSKDDHISVFAWTADRQGIVPFKITGEDLLESDGSFKIEDLDGSPVYLMALDSFASQNDNPYPPRYAPGTYSRDEATLFTFDSGREITGADITLARGGGLVLEGVVTDRSTGAPVPKALVVLNHQDMLSDWITAYTDAQGRYRFDSLGPGAYSMNVDATPFGYVRTRRQLEITAEAQPEALDFALNTGVKITGSFVDKAGSPVNIDTSVSVGCVQLKEAVFRSPVYSGTWSRYVEKGFGHYRVTFRFGSGDYTFSMMFHPTTSTFAVEGVPAGKTTISFTTRTPGRQVVGVKVRGKVLSPAQGFETKPGETLEGVEIILRTTP